jgi:mevalonate kinase
MLSNTFSHYEPAACQGMMASSYMLAHIVLPSLQQHGHDLSKLSIKLTVESQGLPIGAGLGSSAAFAVAVAGACIQLYYKLSKHSSADNELDGNIVMSKEAKDAINAWAFAGEVLIHGQPSGLDNTTSCYGGLVKFAKRDGGNQFSIIENGPELDILLTNTKVPRSTKVLVAGVRQRLERFPSLVQNIFSSIQSISDTFLNSLENNEGSQPLSDNELVCMNAFY